MQNKEEFKRETEIYFEFFIFPKICSICKKKIFLKDGVKIVDKSNEAKTQTTDYYCKECMPTAEDVVHSIDTDNCMFGIAFVDPHTLDKEIERRHLTPPIMLLEENIGSIC